MFRAHRPIFRRVRTAAHTTIGSVSVPLCSRALYVVACLGDYSLRDVPVGPKHVEIQQYTNKTVTSVGALHANRAAQILNQWLCEQLYELS